MADGERLDALGSKIVSQREQIGHVCRLAYVT